MRIMMLVVCALTLSAPFGYSAHACCKDKKHCNMKAHKNGKCDHKDTCKSDCHKGKACSHEEAAKPAATPEKT